MQWKFMPDAPIYSQIIRQMQLFIVSGALAPGARLPAVRELAAEAGVNPNTMQRALSQLEQDGLVYTQRTAGRFVTEDPACIKAVRTTLARRQVTVFLEAMEQLGFRKEEIVELLEQPQEEE